MNEKSFICVKCKKTVEVNKVIGTSHRNHCPHCLRSKHVDRNLAGDRKSSCMGLMRPVSLMFKKVKPDKFSKEKVGEIMIVHQCKKCPKESLNRIAADDDTDKIMELASKENKEEVERQLFGIK